MGRPTTVRRSIRAAARPVARAALVGVLASSLAACGLGGPEEPEAPPREEPGPTLSEAPPPTDWQDVHSATGLLYSAPSDWEIGDPYGPGVPEGPPGAEGPGGADDPARSDGAAAATDWGSGFVTTANAIADRGYCASSGLSFRTLSGISDVIPGEAREQAESASRALADSIERRFTRHGADVPVPEPRKIGVSGVPAWYVSLRGRPHPPLDTCTPPVIRFDAVAVSTRTAEGAPASIVFVLMADEGEPGVQPPETIAAVVASLRYDVTV